MDPKVSGAHPPRRAIAALAVRTLRCRRFLGNPPGTGSVHVETKSEASSLGQSGNNARGASRWRTALLLGFGLAASDVPLESVLVLRRGDVEP
jgi:hypothetical protein